MSHYLVGVIIEDINNIKDEVAKVLAPYDENIDVEPYVRFTKQDIIDDINKRIAANNDYYVDKYGHLTDEEKYQEYYNSYKDDYEFDENGNELSTYNPNSKWDWWQIGGRFSEKEATKIKDFQLYDELSNTEKRLYTKAWKSFNGKCELTDKENEKIFGGFRLWNDQYYLDRYGTLENYLKQIASNIPYAFVDKNGWYEQGEMGWWGCDNATQESIDSYMNFAEKYFTDVANQDKYLVWVDCHI